MKLTRVPGILAEAYGAWREGGYPGARAWWSRKLRERQVFELEEARAAREARAYERWIAEEETRRPPPPAVENGPLLSVLMPVHETPEPWLRRAIESVLAQTYERFELCMADDASSAPHVRRVLESYNDPRIKLTFRTTNGHISACSNSALERVSGEFVALLDHDDELTRDALARVAAELESHPEADLLYSDEDKIDARGRRFAPYFKGSSWNDDLMLATNAFGHLGVYRTELVRAVGGFRMGFEGAQDWDLVHRCFERTSREKIRHVPHVLYHFRAIPGSSALESTAKPYMQESALRALRERFSGSGVRVESGTRAAPLRLHYPLPGGARPSVVSGKDARALNEAARAATGAVLVFLGEGVQASEDALAELAGNALRPEIGCAGGRIVGEDGFVREGGFFLEKEKIVVDPSAGLPEESDGYCGRSAFVQDVSAVAVGGLAIRRELFSELGGFDAANTPRAFFDVDLCLRLKERGLRILFTPHATLRAKTARHRPSSAEEEAYLRTRWRLDEDPLDGPNWRALRRLMA